MPEQLLGARLIDLLDDTAIALNVKLTIACYCRKFSGFNPLAAFRVVGSKDLRNKFFDCSIQANDATGDIEQAGDVNLSAASNAVGKLLKSHCRIAVSISADRS